MKKTCQWMGWILMGAVLLLGACASTPDEEMAALKTEADQAAQNKGVYHHFIELFEQGNWDEDLPKVISEDCVLHYPGGEDVVGLPAMIEGWATFFGPFKDMNVTPLAEMSEGDLVIEFFTFEAIYDGEFMDRQVNGLPIKYNQVEMVRIADGKIVEWWVEEDRLAMMEQLGLEIAWK
jgi:predicted ester cyclase